MRKLMKLSLALLLTGGIYLNAQAVTLEKGWNLKGADCSVDFQNIDNPDIKLVWRYEDGKWELFTKNETIKELAQNLGIETFTKTAPYDGFWILAGAPTEINLCKEESEGNVPIEHSSRPLLRALEGDFEGVYENLKSKEKKTDEEKIAYAVSVLLKCVKEGALSDAGFYVIPATGKVFSVEGTDKRWCNSSQWINDAKELLDSIKEALGELKTVSDNVWVDIPESYLDGDENAVIDKPSLDALKVSLILAKANLEYSLAYDWSGAEKLCKQEENKRVLPYLETLVIKDKSKIEEARNDLSRALTFLKNISTGEIPSMEEDEYQVSLLRWFIADMKGELQALKKLKTSER